MTDSVCEDFIVCGLSSVGRMVATELKRAGGAFVVVDARPECAETASILGARHVQGAPSDPEVLRAAGVMDARSLVVCGESDDENVATVRAARELRADLPIVVRASGESSEQELGRAGADSVVLLEQAGGIELATRALHPVKGEPQQSGMEYRVAEFTVAPDATGAGHTIASLRGGAFVIGLRLARGSFLPQPPAGLRIRPGDMVMALGTPQTLAQLERLLVKGTLPEPLPEMTGLPRTIRQY